jgi:hypothetical protein
MRVEIIEDGNEIDLLPRRVRVHALPPHPGPLPWGEGELTSAAVAIGAKPNDCKTQFEAGMDYLRKAR